MQPRELVRFLPVDKLHHSGLIPVADDGALRCCPLKPVEVSLVKITSSE
jgi:hypothetical protein